MSKSKVQNKESEQLFKKISKFFNKLNQNTVTEDEVPQKQPRADDTLPCTTDCEGATMKKMKLDFFGSSEEYSLESPKLVLLRQSTEDFPTLCEKFTSDYIDSLLAPMIFDSPTVEEPRGSLGIRVRSKQY